MAEEPPLPAVLWVLLPVFRPPGGHLRLVLVIQGVEAAPTLHVVGQLMGEGLAKLRPPLLKGPLLFKRHGGKKAAEAAKGGN